MKKLFLIAAFYLFPVQALATCSNIPDYKNSVVALLRYNGYFDKYEGGTAWFYMNKRTLVTAAHVAHLLFLDHEWKAVELWQRKDVYTLSEKHLARIISVGEGTADLEDLAIIEIASDFKDAIPITKIAEKSSQLHDPFFSIGYPFIKFTQIEGEIVPPENIEYSRQNPSLLYIRTTKNELHLGSSGAPIINCYGEVEGILIRKFHDAFLDAGKIHRRTKFSPTNSAVPYSSLIELLSGK